MKKDSSDMEGRKMKSRWEDCRGAVKRTGPCGADQERIGAQAEIRSRRRGLVPNV